MPFIGPKPADTVLDSTLIADGTITSAKIADGTIVNADLNNSAAIATSKITGLAASATTDTTNAANIASGVIADARISASSVQQHATSFDDNKLVNDISTLGLRVHTQENLNASNTNSASFDVFQDSSGITNLTNCSRSTDEYVSSVSSVAENGGTGLNHGDMTWGYESNYWNMTNTGATQQVNSYNFLSQQRGGFLSGNWYWTFQTNAGSAQGYSPSTNPSTNQAMQWVAATTTADASAENNSAWNNDNSNYFGMMTNEISNNMSVSFFKQKTVQATVSSIDGTSGYFTFVRDSGNNNLKVYKSSSSADYGNGTLLHTFTNFSSTSDMKVIYSTGYAGNNLANPIRIADNVSFKENITTLASLTTNATGSFEGNAITASSSTNKMGAVITYQDNAGTNTLNTDIILKLSADNGSNYSTATLTALPNFATGIKMAKVNDLSVTAGTSLKYKIEFANQASGSKEARIRGVSLQY